MASVLEKTNPKFYKNVKKNQNFLDDNNSKSQFNALEFSVGILLDKNINILDEYNSMVE